MVNFNSVTSSLAKELAFTEEEIRELQSAKRKGSKGIKQTKVLESEAVFDV